MRAKILCTVLFPLATLAAGCGHPEPRSRLEDQSRRVAPLPACVVQLPARRPGSAGTMRTLREEQIVKLMFPAYDEEKRTLPKTPSCTGSAVFDDPMFKDAQLARRTGWPFVEQEGDLVLGSGGDRLKLAWLRTHTLPDGSAVGPVAVVRSGERFAELFALGTYRGTPEHTHLGTARMGGEILVTAENDGCTGHKAGAGCQTVLSVFMPRRGELNSLVEVATENIAYSGRAEKGSLGVLEYHLTSVPAFSADGIKIVEQVRVKDDTGREVRKSERERLFAVDPVSGKAKAAEPSLWDEIVKAAPAPASGTKPAGSAAKP